jgi:hypothetical protein
MSSKDGQTSVVLSDDGEGHEEHGAENAGVATKPQKPITTALLGEYMQQPNEQGKLNCEGLMDKVNRVHLEEGQIKLLGQCLLDI